MIDSCPVERLEHAIGKKYGYVDLRHSLEFFGKCPEYGSGESKQKPTGHVDGSLKLRFAESQTTLYLRQMAQI
jgi:hypothetical protein